MAAITSRWQLNAGEGQCRIADAVTIVEAPPVETACLNCGSPLQGPFCAQCGQRAGHAQPTLQALLHEVVHEFLHVDGKFLQSVQLLFTRPGFLTREYVEGRRVRHVSPLRLYLTFSVIYFAVASVATIKPAFTEDASRGTTLNIGGVRISGEAFFKGRTEEAITERVQHAQHDWPPRLLFVLVPVCGLLVMFATRTSRRHYPEHLWFALHGHAAYFGVLAITLPFELLYDRRVNAGLTAVRLAFLLWYAIVAFHTAYGGHWGTAVRRAVFVGATYGVLISLTLIALFVTALLV